MIVDHKTRVLFASGLIFLLFFSGCTSQKPAENTTRSSVTVVTAIDGMSAEEIRDRALDSGDAQSYAFDMHMTVSMAEGGIPIDMDAKIDVDRANKKMHSVIGTSVLGMTQTSEGYVIGNTQYNQMPTGEWVKTSSATDLWDDDFMESQKNMIRGIDIKLLGSEKVNGVDCYLLEMNVSKEQVAQVLGNQAGNPSGMTEQDIMEMVKDLKVTEWIAKDTFLPSRTLTDMRLGDGNKSMKMAIQIDFRDFDKAMDIELPQAAKDAKEGNQSLTT